MTEEDDEAFKRFGIGVLVAFVLVLIVLLLMILINHDTASSGIPL